jgi:predicted nucleic acid-binding protein
VTRAKPGILDASVAVKCFLDEDGSAAARRAVAERADWIAPDLIFLEVASVALKTMRRGLLDEAQGARMVAGVGSLLVETVTARELSDAAFQLAADHGFSAYDAAYLVLAERRGGQLLTADLKLVNLAKAAGLGDSVMALAVA